MKPITVTDDERARLGPMPIAIDVLAIDRATRALERMSQLEGSTRAALTKIDTKLARHDGDLEELSVIAHAKTEPARIEERTSYVQLVIDQMREALRVPDDADVIEHATRLADDIEDLKRRLHDMIAARDTCAVARDEARAELREIDEAVEADPSRSLVGRVRALRSQLEDEALAQHARDLEERIALARAALEGRP